jgi:hypothetical protein
LRDILRNIIWGNPILIWVPGFNRIFLFTHIDAKQGVTTDFCAPFLACQSSTHLIKV